MRRIHYTFTGLNAHEIVAECFMEPKISLFGLCNSDASEDGAECSAIHIPFEILSDHMAFQQSAASITGGIIRFYDGLGRVFRVLHLTDITLASKSCHDIHDSDIHDSDIHDSDIHDSDIHDLIWEAICGHFRVANIESS